jgi:ppGpp synthetase/RelA/SpoT-type nucleotidyltranferase
MAMDLLVDDFIARYSKAYDFYDQAARLAAQFLEGDLRAAGIRSIVTSRAKAIGRLEEKVRTRTKSPKKKYTCVDDIFEDIVDLAGVRIAMYFPGEHIQVDSIIRKSFSVHEEKSFPKDSKKSKDPELQYKKRFSGYLARHYRVQLKDSVLNDAQKRYQEAKIEIQVASVLMHSWAEVEHDLVYKPQQGPLSYEELAVLDEINGLVLAGEIALEQLQRAGEARVAAGGREFSNHYDLASHLLGKFAPSAGAPIGETALGRIDLLFEFLKLLHLAKPDAIELYIKSLNPDLEKQPLANQIIDQLISEDSERRYPIYKRLRASRPVHGDYVGKARNEVAAEAHEEISQFLGRWDALERKIKEKAKRAGVQGIHPSRTLLSKIGVSDDALLNDFDLVKRTRNEVVHGMSTPAPEDLRDAGRRVEEISKQLEQL